MLTRLSLTFGLFFNAFKYIDDQAEQCEIEIYFVDHNGERLCEKKTVIIKSDQPQKVNFTLYNTASSLKECSLVIRSTQQNPNEALMLIPFKIKMAFNLEFEF